VTDSAAINWGVAHEERLDFGVGESGVESCVFHGSPF
jgi:hypothetical protein